jgi:hypothetical protein
MNMTLRTLGLTILLGGVPCAVAGGVDQRISLAGEWRFQLDRDDAGIQERWFESSLAQQIKLPGSLPAQGVGDDVSADTKWTGDIVDRSWFTDPEYARYRQPGNIKVPFWLQPEKYYAGVAWYQRTIAFPLKWKGKRILLELERPHWATRVWVDGRESGANDSLSTPHEYDLGIVQMDGRGDLNSQEPMGISYAGALVPLQPGEHQLTVRVDNRLVVDVGINSHSISDHTQGNWNGIVGDISLRATDPVWIDDLQVYPSYASKSVRVKGIVGNAGGRGGSGTLSLRVGNAASPAASNPTETQKNILLTWEPEGGAFEFELSVDDARPWNEFNPSLYELDAWMGDFSQRRSVKFGFRDLTAQGTQFALNGRKIFIRGTLECCIFPKTGHPPTDLESWKRIIRIAKAHGLNLIRFHSWCPPEAAFTAADQLGFYYQVEIASWANQSTTLGDGKPVDDWLYREAGRILRSYGNHPSFLLMPYGNEPGGNHANEFLAQWVDHWKAADPRRFYTSGSGWPQLPENQFHVTPEPRIQAWGQGLKSRINAQAPETRTDYREYIRTKHVPVISHEIGQWCVYPNLDEIPKYTGYLKPKNFEVFRDSLRSHGLGHLAHQFLIASGKLQTLCYKEEIESALRTPGMAGFELLDLHDFPGQGTALVGVLDPFWESKGYVTPAEYSRFCNSTVPLARLNKRVFAIDETLDADLEVAHFGAEPLSEAVTSWKLVGDDKKVCLSGSLPARDISIGNGTALGTVKLELKHLPAPARYKFVVTVASGGSHRQEAQVNENDWDVWVYPAQLNEQPAPDVLVSDGISPQVKGKLTSGGKVLLVLSADRLRGDRHGKVALGFSSIFWNTAWTSRQPPHTLGILCDPKQPALKEFPTDVHSNWQWWYVINHAGAMILDDLPKELRPTVQVIDDWVTNRKLGLIFEAKVGPGKLLVCSVDLNSHLEQDPVRRQLRRSLLDYMNSSQFEPRVRVTAEQVEGLTTAN